MFLVTCQHKMTLCLLLYRTQSSVQNAVSAQATVSFKDVIEKMVINFGVSTIAAVDLHYFAP